MPSNLMIHVGVDGNNHTVSKFAVAESGYVALQNDASAKLNVTFPETSPLCLGTERQISIDLSAGELKNYQVCAGAAGQSFKYTATVDGAQPEDPYILVAGLVVTPEFTLIETNPAIKFERLLTGENLFMLAAGILLGIGLTLLLGGSGRNRPRP